jgi:hypothetical protein
MRIALDLLQLRCVRPVTGTGDLCYAIAAGSAGFETRIVHVHPEEKVWADHGYAWPMKTGERRDLRVRMTSAELNDFQTMTLRVIVATRIQGAYASALIFASQLAQQAQSQPEMMSVLAFVSHLPDQLVYGDFLLGEFTLSVTNMGGEATHSTVYSPSAEPWRKQTEDREIALRLTANKANYEILLAVRAPAPPPRAIAL